MFELALAAMLALSSPPPPPAVAEPPTSDQVMAVPPALRAQMDERVDGRSLSQQQRLDLLTSLLLDEGGLELVYDEGANGTVEQSWRTGRVNCLSFTLLFVALARELDLQAHVQEIEQVLVWYQREGTIYTANHVNAGVRIGGRLHTVDIARDAIMARHDPKPVSDQRALALFYNNLAMALLVRGQTDAADAHMRLALELEPDYVPVLNNLGVLRLRAGDLHGAENAYFRALEIAPRYTSTLFNLAQLYHLQGRESEAIAFQRRLERSRRNDPFHQFLAAIDRESRGDYEGAVAHYLRAVRLHRSEHRFHFGLARAYLLLGDQRRAGRALARARTLADDDDRMRYQAKLDILHRRP